MNEKKKRQLFEGSLLDQNSTLESLIPPLIKWGLILAATLLILQEGRAWRLSLSEPKPSITNGCIIPAKLATNVNIPVPTIPEGTLKFRETLALKDATIIDLHRLAVRLIEDRRELARRCISNG